MILQNGWPWLTLTEKVYVGDNSLTKMTEEHTERGKTWCAFLRFFNYKLMFWYPQDFQSIEHTSRFT